MPKAMVSTGAFLVLWFWVVRQELVGKLSTVESAKGQLVACEKNLALARDGPDGVQTKAVSDRSLGAMYHRTLHKPYNDLPPCLWAFAR